MASQGVVANSCLEHFTQWGNAQREKLLVPYNSTDPELPTTLEQDAKQETLFFEDIRRNFHLFSTGLQHDLASLAQSVAIFVASPACIFAEVGRLCCGSIDASTCVKNICTIPKYFVSSIFTAGLYSVDAAYRSISSVSTGLGLLTWHAGEKAVRNITGEQHSVLSNAWEYRDIVYNSLGLTLLAAGAAFIPVPPIQMLALPIILGSIYGTVNNQFSVRECPEYYTMGHYYDGTDLKGHAIKSNNLMIKPIVTGCYATTMVTKLAGLALSAVGTLPYTAAALPVSMAAGMVGGACVVALVVAHIFSSMTKHSLQKNLDDYAELIGMEWNEANRNASWGDLQDLRQNHVEQKRRELATNPEALEVFNQRLGQLTTSIEENILRPSLPVKYIVGWQANNTRNSVGYLFAGGGTLAVAVATVFLRVFAL